MDSHIDSLQKRDLSGVVLQMNLSISDLSFLSYFLNSLDVKDSSRDLYKRTLKQFFLWINETHKDINGLTRADIIEYKHHLLGKGLSSLSVSSYITSLKKFYSWTESEKIYPNIAKGIKTPRRIQAFRKSHLTEPECIKLLDFIQKRNDRDYAIVNLILRTGLRTIEITRLNISDITFKSGKRILKVWGKGHDEKDDFVILTDKAYSPIEHYLKKRDKANANEPLFISDSHGCKHGRLTTRTISKICKEGLKAIGINDRAYTAHSLRHTTAVTILKHGGDMTAAQTVLRHSNPSTTQIYTASIMEELRLSNSPEELIDKAF